MPITTKYGSIFDSKAEVIVIPVNCVGVMGKGLALEAKKRYPDECKNYMWICENGLRPGDTYSYERLLFAATKRHWSNPSELRWVESCLENIPPYALHSIAIPQLGCGCGGLDWADVEPLIHKHLGELDCDVEIWIYRTEKEMRTDKFEQCVSCGGDFLEDQLDEDHMCEICAREYQEGLEG